MAYGTLDLQPLKTRFFITDILYMYNNCIPPSSSLEHVNHFALAAMVQLLLEQRLVVNPKLKYDDAGLVIRIKVNLSERLKFVRGRLPITETNPSFQPYLRRDYLVYKARQHFRARRSGYRITTSLPFYNKKLFILSFIPARYYI